jgi:hypothetical protein
LTSPLASYFRELGSYGAGFVFGSYGAGFVFFHLRYLNSMTLAVFLMAKKMNLSKLAEVVKSIITTKAMPH